MPKLVEQITGYQVPSDYDTLITVVVMLIAIYGISAGYKKIFPGTNPKHLTQDYDRLVQVAGNYINVPAEQVDKVIRATVDGPRRRPTETAARRFFSPVRGRKNRGIRGPGQAQITEEAISEIPYEALAPVEEGPKTSTEFHNNVVITLHAADKDRAAQGLAGHIKGVLDDRIRMLVDKAIEPKRLFGRRTIRGDVLVVYEATPEGDLVPKEFHLLAIRLSRRSPSQK